MPVETSLEADTLDTGSTQASERASAGSQIPCQCHLRVSIFAMLRPTRLLTSSRLQIHRRHVQRSNALRRDCGCYSPDGAGDPREGNGCARTARLKRLDSLYGRLDRLFGRSRARRNGAQGLSTAIRILSSSSWPARAKKMLFGLDTKWQTR